MKWETRELGEFAVVRGGSVNPAKHPEEVFDLLSIPAFDAGIVDVRQGKEIGSSKKCVEPNDVLISKIVPHIRRCWVVPEKSEHRQIASGEWIQFRSADLLPDFMRHFLVSDPFHSRFMQTISGVGGSLLRARPAEVFKIQIPLPPLAEQKRIAGILDAADALRAKRRESLAQLDTLLQSTFLDMFGDPVTNPMGWDQTTIGSELNILGGYAFKSADFEDAGLPIIRISNLNGKSIDLTNCARVPANKIGKGERFKLQCSDILIAMSGATTGKLGIVTEEIEETLYLNQRVGAFRVDPDGNILQSFLFQLLASDFYQRHVQNLAGGAAQPNISGKQLESARIPLPPLPLQQRFAAIVKKIEAQKARCRAHLAELDALFASLQSRAFQGEL